MEKVSFWFSVFELMQIFVIENMKKYFQAFPIQ